MRLARFIEREMEAIIAIWVEFAATCLPAGGQMRHLELRDHVAQILHAIVADLDTYQTRGEQSAKARGLAPSPFPAGETAAQTHAVLRARSGFDINQLVAEYRALRASALRLWLDSARPDSPLEMEDMLRFNEAIDQALAESISFFHGRVERVRNLLLGMVGHDMRTPLQTIQLTALALAQLNADGPVAVAAARLIKSGGRIQGLLDDLVDFNRTQLGLGIAVNPYHADLAALCQEDVALLRATYPQRRIEFEADGDCAGWWDGRRVLQVLGNLVTNAVRYGAPDAPVRVSLHGGGDGEVVLRVCNEGTIDTDELAHMFEPLRRGSAERGRNDGGLGLGLYIASEISRAHGGTIAARAVDGHTTMELRLPRRASADGA